MYKIMHWLDRMPWSVAIVFLSLVTNWACVYAVAGLLHLEPEMRADDYQHAAMVAEVTSVGQNSASKKRKPPKPEQLAAAEIKSYLKDHPLKLAPGETFVDGVRRFVTDNSVHKIDEIFRGYSDDLALMMRKILRRAQSHEPPPHLECSTRSGAMLEILDAYGIRSRQTILFTDVQAQLKSHTFLEVWNERAGKWEIQDPDYATYYIERATGERVGAERIVKEPIDRFMPCRRPGDCNWTHAGKLRDYFGVFAFVQQGLDNLKMTVNSSRFELGKVFEHPTGSHDLETFVRREWPKALPEIKIVQ